MKDSIYKKRQRNFGDLVALRNTCLQRAFVPQQTGSVATFRCLDRSER